MLVVGRAGGTPHLGILRCVDMNCYPSAGTTQADSSLSTIRLVRRPVCTGMRSSAQTGRSEKVSLAVAFLPMGLKLLVRNACTLPLNPL